MSDELSDVLESFPDSYRIAVMSGDEAVDVGLSVGNLTVMSARSDALYASQARLSEAVKVLEPFASAPDDWTVESVNAARAFIATLGENKN